MKKICTALLGIALLAGCTDEASGEKDIKNDAIVKEETVNEPIVKEETEKAPIVKEENEALNDLPEYDIWAQYIDLSTFEADVETDNNNIRVIFFEDGDGQKSFKSVFLKEANHLKLVSLDDDGLIHDDVIK